MKKSDMNYKQDYITGLIDLAEREYYKRCKEKGVLHPISFKFMMLGYTMVVFSILIIIIYIVV